MFYLVNITKFFKIHNIEMYYYVWVFIYSCLGNKEQDINGAV